MGMLKKPSRNQECELFECYGMEVTPVPPVYPPYNNTPGNGGGGGGGGNKGGGNNGGGGKKPSVGCTLTPKGFEGARSAPEIVM